MFGIVVLGAFFLGLCLKAQKESLGRVFFLYIAAGVTGSRSPIYALNILKY